MPSSKPWPPRPTSFSRAADTQEPFVISPSGPRPLQHHLDRRRVPPSSPVTGSNPIIIQAIGDLPERQATRAFPLDPVFATILLTIGCGSAPSNWIKPFIYGLVKYACATSSVDGCESRMHAGTKAGILKSPTTTPFP
jgi:hypothetical protein